ncbi:MAG: fibrinogen-like YCDxxxxGGGW domain-containing protein [Oligoflexus sp.]
MHSQYIYFLLMIVISLACKSEKEAGTSFEEAIEQPFVSNDEMAKDVVVVIPDEAEEETEAPAEPVEESFQVVIIEEGVARLVPYSSCKEIKDEVSDAPSGIYLLRVQDAAGVERDIQASCDMQTDNGGWTLVANYVHQGGTTPATQIRTEDLPLQNGDELGLNEAASEYWGHASNSMVNAFAFTEVRLHCRTDEHDRIMDFKTSLNTCLDYFRTGQGDCNNVDNNFTPLNNHNAILPADQTRSEDNLGDDMMIGDIVGRLSNQHWRMGTNNNQWECDNNPDNGQFHTIHRIWIR